MSVPDYTTNGHRPSPPLDTGQYLAVVTERKERQFTDSRASIPSEFGAVFDGEAYSYDVRLGVIRDQDGQDIDTFEGPVSEDWLPDEWDKALNRAGYRRVSDWDISGAPTAQLRKELKDYA
jgi:hypothetical protein